MIRLEDLRHGARVTGIVPQGAVTVVDVHWIGSTAVELTYKTPTGQVANQLLYRFLDHDLVIARLDKLSRNEAIRRSSPRPTGT